MIQNPNDDITLTRSFAVFLKLFFIGTFLALWGILSIGYCAADFFGHLPSQVSSPAIAIPMLVGLITNCIWPLMVPALLFPAQLTLRPSGILYKYYGRTTTMSWTEISEINYKSPSGGRYSSDGKWTVINGPGRQITIPPMFKASAEDLGRIILTYRNKNVKTETQITGDVTKNTMEYQSDLSTRRLDETVHETQAKKRIRLYIFVVIAITVFFMAVISFILYSLKLAYPSQ